MTEKRRSWDFLLIFATVIIKKKFPKQFLNTAVQSITETVENIIDNK